LGPSRIIRRTMLMVAAPRRLCASVPSASSCPLQLLLLRAPASSLHFSAGPPLLLLALLICKVIVVGLLAWFFLFSSFLFNFHLLVSLFALRNASQFGCFSACRALFSVENGGIDSALHVICVAVCVRVNLVALAAPLAVLLLVTAAVSLY